MRPNIPSYHMDIICSSLLTLPLSLFFFIISIIFISIIWLSLDSRKPNLPPSPPKLPLIGNFHQLGSIPHRSLKNLSEKHGPIMLLHFGRLPTLVISSAEGAKEIFKTRDSIFSGRPFFTIPNILFYGSKEIIFSAYGEHWRQLKSLVVQKILSGARVKSFNQIRKEETDVTIRRLGESCGSVVVLTDLLYSHSSNIICRAAFGKNHNGSKFTNLLRNFFDVLTFHTVGSYFPWLKWLDRLSGVIGKAEKIAKEFDEFLQGIIEEHVNERRGDDEYAENDNNGQEDIVDILLDIQEDKTTGFTLHTDTLKGVIMDMFTGGTHTSSTTLEWTISELIKQPRVMKKLQQEVSEIAQGEQMVSEESLEKMPYLKAVVKESLRLHPASPFLVPRVAIEDVKIMGYDIKAGTQVLVNVWAIGRDPAVWEEPNEFRPERFLNNSIDYKGVHYEWLPFGTGRRGCPGAQFSAITVENALANIIYKFDFSLPNGVKNEDLDMTEAHSITLVRKSPLLVLATPRI